MKTFVLLAVLLFFIGCKQKATSPVIGVTKDEVISASLADDSISLESVVEIESSGASDMLLSSILSEMLEKDFDLAKKSRFSIGVLDGEVMIAGGVEREEMINIASRIAWSIEGVQYVNNQVVIDKKPNLKSSVNFDKILYNEIAHKLDANENINFENYRIAVYKKKIYIMGNAESLAELRRVSSLVRRTEGIVNIMNYVRVKK